MKKYIASVRDKETNKLEIIEREYPTKKQFREDLKGNGYAIRFIATEETLEYETLKFHRCL